jgi:hypothetical protein
LLRSATDIPTIIQPIHQPGEAAHECWSYRTASSKKPHPQRKSWLEFLEDLTPILTHGKLDELNPRILASTGFKLHRFSPPVQLSESVYIFLRL